MKNCPNCGAPYDVSSDTCPYCKTSYFDMSAIDINDRQPFYIKIRVGDSVFTSKVIADSEISFCMTPVQYYVQLGIDDNQPIMVRQDHTCDINLTLHSVSDARDNLFTIKEEEK